MNTPTPPSRRVRAPLDPRGGDEQAADQRGAEVAGRGDDAAGDAAVGHEAVGEAARVRLDRDRGHVAADQHGGERVPAFVDPGREQPERIEQQVRPWRQAERPATRRRDPQPAWREDGVSRRRHAAHCIGWRERHGVRVPPARSTSKSTATITGAASAARAVDSAARRPSASSTRSASRPASPTHGVPAPRCSSPSAAAATR